MLKKHLFFLLDLVLIIILSMKVPLNISFQSTFYPIDLNFESKEISFQGIFDF
jgi:hypothetical protein